MTTGGQTKWRRAACTQPGFDDTLYLKPGVGEWLVRMPGALRPIVQATLGHLCSRAVARPGGRGLPGRVPFGSSRASLQRVKSPLREAQGASCFYCGSQVSASGTEVDHFIPWSRRPDNGLHNLVAAHTVCNNAKRDSLAGTEHLARWLDRLAAGRGEHPTPMEVSEQLRWPADPARGIGSARAAYLWLPEGTLLWQAVGTYMRADPVQIRSLLLTTAA